MPSLPSPPRPPPARPARPRHAPALAGLHRLTGGLAAFADLLLPRVCGACAQALSPRERGLCAGCIAAAPGRARRRCPGCGLADEGSAPCARCVAGAPPYDATLAWADYAPPLDRLVGALKFRGQWWLGGALGDAMARSLGPAAAALAPAQVTWVPLGPARLRERGYDQTRAIARRFCHGVGWPAPRPLLRRTRDTAAQSATGGGERWANVAGAFVTHAPVAGGTVALVDDVMTTGATVSAAAEALKRAGARRVVVVVAARAPV